MSRFLGYRWTGNVRELKGALEYAFVIAEQGPITPEHLPAKIMADEESPGERRSAPPAPSRDKDLSEKATLIEALRQSGGNQSQAARLLGVNRVTVYNRMKKYGLEVKRVLRS
jgi:transcriptional regulator of acetoin/glycerol metabolism